MYMYYVHEWRGITTGSETGIRTGSGT
jgi:hypothetical protein